jgi:hypothetical protein
MIGSSLLGTVPTGIVGRAQSDIYRVQIGLCLIGRRFSLHTLAAIYRQVCESRLFEDQADFGDYTTASSSCMP